MLVGFKVFSVSSYELFANTGITLHQRMVEREEKKEKKGKLAALNLLLMPIIAEGVCNCQWWAMRVVITKG